MQRPTLTHHGEAPDLETEGNNGVRRVLSPLNKILESSVPIIFTI
jgi:hypothetical protein